MTLTPINPVVTPAKVAVQSMVIDLVMVTAPNPPGSRQLMIPFAAVFEIAPANVLHGSVRPHGLASSPTPETQVRVAWACAGSDLSIGRQRPSRVARNSDDAILVMGALLLDQRHRVSAIGVSAGRHFLTRALHRPYANLCPWVCRCRRRPSTSWRST